MGCNNNATLLKRTRESKMERLILISVDRIPINIIKIITITPGILMSKKCMSDV